MDSSHHPHHIHNHQRQGSRVRFAEEEPGLEVYHPQPVRSHHPARPGAATASAADTAPEVYWADDNDDDPNASKYTFYREGTPTPPEYEEEHHEKGDGFGNHGAAGISVAAVAAAVAHRTPSPGTRAVPAVFPPFDPPRGNDDNGGGGSLDGSHGEGDGVSPTKKRKFHWAIALFAVLFVITPIAVGTGLGVGLKKPGPVTAQGATGASSSGDSTSSSVPGSTSNAVPSSSITATSTTGRPFPTLPPGGILPDCPAGNNTLYTVPGLTKTFLRVCGIDYSGADGATDLTHIYTDSMVDCMNVCASYDRCTGCGWGAVAGDTGLAHRCWMKSNLQVPHKARDDYCFGILQS